MPPHLLRHGIHRHMPEPTRRDALPRVVVKRNDRLRRIEQTCEGSGEARRCILAEFRAADAVGREIAVRVDAVPVPFAAALDGDERAAMRLQRRNGGVEGKILVVMYHHEERTWPAGGDGLDCPRAAALFEFIFGDAEIAALDDLGIALEVVVLVSDIADRKACAAGD